MYLLQYCRHGLPVTPPDLNDNSNRMLATCDVIDRLVSMMNSRFRITGEVSMSWSHMVTRLNDVGIRKRDERLTMACELLLFVTIRLSLSHVFASCTQASIRARACVWSVDGKVMYSRVSSAYRW